jgi:hypothetical protein
MVLAVRERGVGRPIVLLPWFGLDGGVTELAFEPAFAEPPVAGRLPFEQPETFAGLVRDWLTRSTRSRPAG